MNINLPEATEMVLDSALLLYKSKSAAESLHYISRHDVIVRGGIPTIQPGEGITEEAFIKIMMAAAPKGAMSALGWTTERSVFVSPSVHAWWSPAQLRWMHFNSDEIETTNKAHNPALLWVVAGPHLHIFALKENTRPTQDTFLFQAPVYNVDSGGGVCFGSMHILKDANPSQWEEAFYGSAFSHPGQHGLELTSNHGGHVEVWQGLLADQTLEFPVEFLKPMPGLTVAGLISKVGRQT